MIAYGSLVDPHMDAPPALPLRRILLHVKNQNNNMTSSVGKTLGLCSSGHVVSLFPAHTAGRLRLWVASLLCLSKINKKKR